MKPYNIAVCLSGEPRTYKYALPTLKNFFETSPHNIKYFGHTWDTTFFNKESWTGDKPEYHVIHDKNELTNELNSLINFSDLLIESQSRFIYNQPKDFIFAKLDEPFGAKNAANLKRPHIYDQMSYSIMMANELKTKYELENHMQFDLVVRTRFDLCYRPNTSFQNILNTVSPIVPTALYCDTHYFPKEFLQGNVNEIFYFGTNSVMNTVDGFYRYFGDGTFWKMMDENWFDSTLKIGGYNINLYKWLNLKNIITKNINTYGFMTVYRMTAIEKGYTSQLDYENIAISDQKIGLL